MRLTRSSMIPRKVMRLLSLTP